MSRLLIVTALLALAFTAAVARPAAAATPCWKALLTDWYDGRIDNTYPLHCYTDALKHLPPDVRTYSSAHDDILRALQSARAKLRNTGKTNITPTTILPAPGTTKTDTTQSTTTVGGGANGGGPSGGDAGGGSPGRQSGKGLQGVANDLNPSSPSSLPVPLLVLGGLAILLVAAGGVGVLVKRLQGRRDAP
jgi:hypothetical protein